jgi:hypothetical protein
MFKTMEFSVVGPIRVENYIEEKPLTIFVIKKRKKNIEVRM